jgi:nitrogen fixation-related uncharacterized protein
MWEIIINISIVVIGVALLSLLVWAMDRQEKYDETYMNLDYGDDEEL